MTEVKNRKKFTAALAELFSSKILAITLIIIIGIVAFLGTIIPQEDIYSHEEILNYDENNIVPRTLNELLTLIQISDRDPWKSSIYSVYHSWWFMLSIILLSINLIVCSVVRFPDLVTVYNRLNQIPDKKQLSGYTCSEKLPIRSEIKSAAEKIRNWGKKRFRVREEAGDKTCICFRYQIHRFSRFGYCLVHLGLLIIIVGAMITAFSREKGFVWIKDGGEVDKYYSRNTEQEELLPFTIKAGDLEIEMYEDGVSVKDWFSTLSLYSDGREIARKRIEVNDPLYYDGRYFYQANWNYGYQIIIAVTDNKSGRTEIYPVEIGIDFENVQKDKIYSFPDGKLSFRISGFFPHFTISPDGYSTRSQELINPAAILHIYWQGLKDIKEKVIFSLFPDSAFREMHPDRKEKGDEPYKFVLLKNINIVDYTGIEISYDPGRDIVYAGFIPVILGIIGSFYFNHRRYWILVESSGKGTCEVSFAGMTRKNRYGFRRQFAGLAGSLSAEIGTERDALKQTKKKSGEKK